MAPRAVVVVSLVLTLLPACSRCGAPPSPGGAGASTAVAEERVTPAELEAVLDWQLELNTIVKEVVDEARRDMDSRDPAEPVEVATERMMERTRQGQARTKPVLEREPLKGTRKGKAIQAVIEAFYVSGAFFRDEKQLAKLREQYGKALIDSIADQEALIREKRSP